MSPDPKRKRQLYAKRRKLIAGWAEAQGKTPRECERCGKRSKIQYHHRDPATKSFNVSAMPIGDPALVQAELAKCDCICKPCHTYHHSTGGRGTILQTPDSTTFRVSVAFPTKEAAEHARQLVLQYRDSLPREAWQ